MSWSSYRYLVESPIVDGWIWIERDDGYKSVLGINRSLNWSDSSNFRDAALVDVPMLLNFFRPSPPWVRLCRSKLSPRLWLISGQDLWTTGMVVKTCSSAPPILISWKGVNTLMKCLVVLLERSLVGRESVPSEGSERKWVVIGRWSSKRTVSEIRKIKWLEETHNWKLATRWRLFKSASYSTQSLELNEWEILLRPILFATFSEPQQLTPWNWEFIVFVGILMER